MDFFEYILILTSVIFAMGIAQILSGISAIAHSKAPVKPYTAHTLWVFIIFVYVFLVWWATWEFRDIEWTFAKYLFMILGPTFLYVACSLIMPRDIGDEPIDMEAHFFRVRKPLYWSFLLGSLAAVTDGYFLSDEPAWHQGRIGHIVALIATIWGIASDNRRAHVAIAIILSVSFGFVTVLRFWIPR